MAFTELERVRIRKYLGFPAVYLQAEPRLESAITAVQSTQDGGSRPDSSTEDAIRGYLVDLAAVEEQLKAFWTCSLSTAKVDRIEVDAIRGAAWLKSEARRIVGYLSDCLSTHPRRDVFSGPELMPPGFSDPVFIREGMQ